MRAFVSLAEVTGLDILGYVPTEVWPPKLSGDCPLSLVETTMTRVRGIVTLMHPGPDIHVSSPEGEGLSGVGLL